MMERRSINLTEAYVKILRTVFEREEAHRKNISNKTA
jgi:hypothetical protein